MAKLRRSFALRYPEDRRIERRRAFERDQLGIRLKPYLPPFILSPGRVFTCAGGRARAARIHSACW